MMLDHLTEALLKIVGGAWSATGACFKSERVPLKGPTVNGWIGEIPDEVIRDHILPLLKLRDLIKLDRAVQLCVLTEVMQTCSVMLSDRNITPVLKWLSTRHISPSRVTFALSNKAEASLRSVAPILRHTKSFKYLGPPTSPTNASVIHTLRAFHDLRELDFGGLHLDDNILSEVSRLTQLCTLKFVPRHCSSRCLLATIGSLPQLHSLTLYDCTKFRQPYEITRADGGPIGLLQGLTLRVCSRHAFCIESSFLSVLEPFLEIVVRLEIFCGSRFLVQGAQHLLKACPNVCKLFLRNVHVEHGHRAIYVEAVGRLNNLRSLDVSGSVGCVDAIVAAAAEGSSSLQVLTAERCSDLTDACITALRTHAHTLRVLRCQGSAGITHTALQELVCANSVVRISADFNL